MKTNIFKQTTSAMTDADFQIIYEKLKEVPKNQLHDIIEQHYKDYGIIFLDKTILNSILDFELKTTDSTKMRRIKNIEKLCTKLKNNYSISLGIKQIVRSVPAKLVTVSAIGCFVIELIRLITDLICHG